MIPTLQLGQAGRSFAAGDPFFANVSLLCRFDGNILDATGNNVLTSVASPTLVSGSGGPFTGVGYIEFTAAASQYLSLPTSSAFDFGAGDFTFECWAYLIASSQAYGVIFNTRAGDTAAGLAVKMNNLANNQFGVEMYKTDATAAMTPLYPAGSLSLTTWGHVAVTRQGGTMRAFVNGTQTGTSAVAGTLYYDSTNLINIGGQLTPSRTTRARFSNMRVTKGIARYTSAFTAPTAPF